MSVIIYRRIVLVMALVMTVGVPALAQQAAAKKTSTSASKPQSLTVDGVLDMVQAGLSDDVIVARLRKEAKPFDLSSDDMIRMKQAKVSDAVLKVMLDPKADLKPATAYPAPVVVQSPIFTGIGSTRPSGATPLSSGNATGDPDDPMIPHDSGIYLYTKDHQGKPQMVVLERASLQGSKTGGFFGSAMTYGIVKAKTKAAIPGAHANLRVTESSPVFYFYFDDKQAGLGKTYFGMNTLSNPNQFALLKLEVKKSDRETVIGKYSAWGSSSGTDSGATIQFKSERIRTGLYKVVVDGMQPGEYCFFATSGGTTAAGPIAVTTTTGADIFDFGVGTE
jgi:hypothetical protein